MLEWNWSQDNAAHPGFASRFLEKGPATPAAGAGFTASLGAVWLHGAAVQLGSFCTKHRE